MDQILDLQHLLGEIRHVVFVAGRHSHVHWFALACDPDAPEIRVITMNESMAVPRFMASQMTGRSPQFLLYGRYQIVDLLWGIRPPIAGSASVEAGSRGTAEIV